MQLSYGNLAESLVAIGKIDDAELLLEKALEINLRDGNQYYTAINYQTLMYIGFKRRDLDAAKGHASSCLQIAYECDYRSIVRDVCYQIGKYYNNNGDEDVAQVFFKKASNADGRISPDIFKELDIDIINSRGTSLGDE
jgi:tetratricopeptide (TPR) repeat protein